MKIHLIDGTYELFRAYYGAPPRKNPEGIEVGAALAFSRTLMVLLRQKDSSHLACAFDHTVESFRNDLFAGYKTGEGIETDLLGQFSLVERAASALGLVIWPMVEFEADDALATGALRFSTEPEVEQVVVCSPDKDLAQCVQGSHVVCLDRRRDRILDEEGVIEKFGVPPESIPDWLALMGDSADGIPGVPGWGANSLAANLKAHREEVFLYRTLATLRTDVPLKEKLDDLKWKGVRGDQMEALAQELGTPRLLAEAEKLTP